MPQGRAEVALEAKSGPGVGQTLRTALSLSLCTGVPFRLWAERLSPEHLAYVRSAEAISASKSDGATAGSSSLWFQPGPVRPGEYVLEVGPAGSATLLVQCLFYPLALAGGGQLVVRGGTHPLDGPTAQYLAQVWLPAVQAFGFSAHARLMQAGFPPQGSGELRVRIDQNGEPPTLVELPSRGTLYDVEVVSLVGGLPLQVAQRQSGAAHAVLARRGIYCHVENRPLKSAAHKGSAVFIRAHFENTFAGFGAVGDGKKSPEEIGGEAAEQLGQFMASQGALDRHLADQLLVPAALLASGALGQSKPATTRFTAEALSSRCTLTANVVERFCPSVRVALEAELGRVSVEPA